MSCWRPSIGRTGVWGQFILTLGHWLLQRKLRSESLRKDAITSGAVAVLSAAIVVSTLVYGMNVSLWWFDSVVALGVSLALCCAGTWSLVSTRWWCKGFWTGAPDSAVLLQRSECSLSAQL